jgi:DNA-directed RNA polymerase subunit RPC12/RpoP
MKCGDCGQDILQTHPEMCPYCRSKNLIAEEETSKEIKTAEQLAKAGRYEEAALTYEKLDLWNQARECRRTARKKHVGTAKLENGKIGVVTIICPHCGEPKPVTAQTKEETCSRCGTTYNVPNNVLELLGFDKKA